MPTSLTDWLMAGDALKKAGGQAPAAAAPLPLMDPSYLQKQIAANPNNFPQGAAPAENPYETKLHPSQESQFTAWKAAHAPNDSGEDYDLRGLFQSGMGTDARGHATDKFKKPNHPTFSIESQYSTPENPGGQWIKRDNKTFFVPSPANLKGRTFEELQAYFQQNEPDVTLVKAQGPPQASAAQPPLSQFADQQAAKSPYARTMEFLGNK